MSQLPDPPQHLLGGLNVALVTAQGANADQVDQTKTSLEEMGVNVVVVGAVRGAIDGLREDGSAGTLEVAQKLSIVEADAFDAALVIADAQGARQLAQDEQLRAFLAGLDQEGKPIGAIGDGVLPILSTGLARARTVSAPQHLAQAAQEAGAQAETSSGVSVDANVLSATDSGGLEGFNSALKHLLAERRRATMTLDNDSSSAVGEDG